MLSQWLHPFTFPPVVLRVPFPSPVFWSRLQAPASGRMLNVEPAFSNYLLNERTNEQWIRVKAFTFILSADQESRYDLLLSSFYRRESESGELQWLAWSTDELRLKPKPLVCLPGPCAVYPSPPPGIRWDIGLLPLGFRDSGMPTLNSDFPPNWPGCQRGHIRRPWEVQKAVNFAFPLFIPQCSVSFWMPPSPGH